jgi:D-alanyl-D-alanine carboxypeptidase
MSTPGRRLQPAVEAQITAGAPGALARVEGAGADLIWEGSAGVLARGTSPLLKPDDAFRAASVTKHVTAAVVVRLDGEGRVGLDDPLDPKDPTRIQGSCSPANRHCRLRFARQSSCAADRAASRRRA